MKKEKREQFYKVRLNNTEVEQIKYIKENMKDVNVSNYVRYCIKRLYEEVTKSNAV